MEIALFLKNNFNEQGSPYNILERWEWWEIMLSMHTMNDQTQRENEEAEKRKKIADGKTIQYYKKSKEQSEVSKKWREKLKAEGKL